MMNKLLRERPRGFVLIVALLLGVATAAVAVGLIQTSGSANVAVVHSNAGENAKALADAGLARAESYALTISRGAVDFDRVLDPANQADCSNLDQVTDSGVVPETGDMYLPRFTDGSVITFEGLRWRLVPYNGGAYLVRFSDNFDDSVSAPGPFPIPDWTNSTSNLRSGSPGAATFCAEGPTATTAAPTPGIAGVNNPARDRDRTIYVNVIGIFPGTNPATAKHRAMVSKVLMDGRVVGPAGMRVGGDVRVRNGAEAEFCSEISGISATGFVADGPPGSCACGAVQGSTVDVQDGSCGACCGTNTFQDVDGASQPPPVIPDVRNRDWYDWTSSCNFYVDRSSHALYYWDADGTRGGVACNTHTGNLLDPDVSGTNMASCWVPLWRNNSGVFTAPLPVSDTADANREVNLGVGCAASGGTACQVEWRPRNNTVTANIGTTAVAPALAYYTGAATVNVTKPNWATACPKNGAPSDFRWSPPQLDTGSGEEVACTTCTGINTTWRAVEGAEWVLEADSPDKLRAHPVGVYFHKGDLSPNWNAVVPTTQSPATNWPMITLMVEGNVLGANASDIVLGVGSRKRLFPSLVVNGNLTTNNAVQLAFAGSLYVRGNVTFDHGNAGGTEMFGRVEVLGSLEVKAGARIDWDYDQDLFAAGITRRARPPRLSLPTGF